MSLEGARNNVQYASDNRGYYATDLLVVISLEKACAEYDRICTEQAKEIKQLQDALDDIADQPRGTYLRWCRRKAVTHANLPTANRQPDPS